MREPVNPGRTSFSSSLYFPVVQAAASIQSNYRVVGLDWDLARILKLRKITTGLVKVKTLV